MLRFLSELHTIKVAKTNETSNFLLFCWKALKRSCLTVSIEIKQREQYPVAKNHSIEEPGFLHQSKRCFIATNSAFCIYGPGYMADSEFTVVLIRL